MRVLGLLLWAGLGCWGQEWPHYGGDAGGMRYSPLKEINRGNVRNLRVAWTYHTGDVSDGSKWPVRSAFEATPLVVGGVMYVTTPFCRLVALDPETGRELWSFDPKIPRDGYYPLFVNRGPAWWSNGRRSRLFFGTLDGRLFSIDAATGRPVETFGGGGSVNLRAGVADNFPNSGYGMTSPPLIYKDLVICGSFLNDGTPQGPSGAVRAFDVHTGKLAWRFNTVPQEGEYGNDTWEKDSWRDRGGANLWSIASLDAARGIVFLPLTSPAFDYYGGDRKGANLFGDSLVALDAATGKRLWHFQTVHHNIWDYDLPAQPNLVTLRRGGAAVPAVVQVTKTGFVFVFDRATGKPLFDIEERPVPSSEVPGEQAYPTQPFPLKPPPFARQSFSLDELTDVTPESRAFCAKLLDGAAIGSLYTPIGLNNTVLFPGTNGGANWGGASFDPETRTLYVNSMDVGMVFRLVARPEGSGLPYRSRGAGTPNSRFWDPNLYPCQKPPWGQLTAIDLDRGEFRWRKVLGVVDELIAKGLPPTGTSNLGGSIVTAGGLVFIGATNDSRFRAFDKDTGEELWVTKLPASAHATPMTYQGPKSKKQFLVIAAGGGNKYNNNYSDALVAFTLAGTSDNFQPGPLSKERVRAAAVAAGFEVRELMADIPAAVRSNLRFTPLDYDEPRLAALREKYRLEEVVSGAKDEWSAQLLLKQWVYDRIPGGNPRLSPATAIEVLDLAAKGERFYCTYYAITYVECAQALGWQARKIGVDRKHGPEGMGSTHHGAAEVWSNQFRKWVVMDSQSNLHFEKRGVPLSAWEIRAEWLASQGAAVDHVVGIPPNTVNKNPAIVWWDRPGEDETATYFWIYITDRAGQETGARHIFPLDEAHDGAVWYQNDPAGSTLHLAYRRNQFLPTRRLADAYWTVGVVEAAITQASPGTIRLALGGYDPYRTAFEASFDGKTWERVPDPKSLAWSLQPGWNMLRLRSLGRRGVTGPESAIVMFLDPPANHTSIMNPLEIPR